VAIRYTPFTSRSTILVSKPLTGIITVTLQIAYLPTLYSAFNRRENEVALLNARAGVPSWGPELLARTHYALGSGVSTIDTLPDLYGRWERWAADVAESHATYLSLVRFRSPKPLSSWVTALLAVLDSAALFLALSPKEAPVVPARLCLRSGLLCFNEVASAMGIKIPDVPGAPAVISLSYGEFLDAIARMREVNFPIEREPEEAWPDFVGWRVNYERAAYAVAAAVDAWAASRGDWLTASLSWAPVRAVTLRSSGGDGAARALRGLVELAGRPVFAAPLHEVTPVFETRFGWHVAMVHDRRPEGIMELDAAAGPITEALYRNQRDREVGRQLDVLRRKAEVQVRA